MDYEAIYSDAYNEATKRFENRSDVDIDDVAHGYGLRAVVNAALEDAAAACEMEDAYGSGDAVEMKTRCADIIRQAKERTP